MAIPEEIISAVRERASITEIISETVALKRSGRNLVGLCPFHSEKTPSFNVREEEGAFHCFGCGKGGSVFNFLMDTRGLTFPEAVRFLANRFGIQIPESVSQRDDQHRTAHVKSLRFAARLAQETYTRCLTSEPIGKRGIEYLRERGISEQTSEAFVLGFAPPGWNFLHDRVAVELKKKRPEVKEDETQRLLLELGLLKLREQEDGEPAQPFFDVFRDRLIFPITRSDGSVIAFGGRTLLRDTSVPKYLNSKESPIYQKRRALFGMSQALSSLRKTRQAYLVEGYLDVLSMVQRGFPNVVACCGTAVTEQHVDVLRRVVDRVTVIFDGDTAGRKAAASCFEVFLNSGLTVSAVLLDEGEDPDSISRKLDPAAIEAMLSERLRPIVDLYLEQLFSILGEKRDGASATAIGRVSESFVGLLNRVKNPVEQEFLIRRGGELLGVSVTALAGLMKQSRRPPSPTPRGELKKTSSPPPTEKTQPLNLPGHVRQLLVALVAEPRLAASVLQMPSLIEGSEFLVTLPSSVREFVRELAAEPLIGIAQLVGKDEAEVAAACQVLQALLAKYELSSLGIIEEALSQCRIGGVNFVQVVRDVRGQSARLSLMSEIELLKLDDTQERSEEELAQEKLRKKRVLHALQARANT